MMYTCRGKCPYIPSQPCRGQPTIEEAYDDELAPKNTPLQDCLSTSFDPKVWIQGLLIGLYTPRDDSIMEKKHDLTPGAGIKMQRGNYRRSSHSCCLSEIESRAKSINTRQSLFCRMNFHLGLARR